MNAPAPIGTLAHYTLLERLEPSGPGEMYRARDTHRGRTVVVRWLPPELTPDEAARQALIDTARGTTVLSHPNVTALFDLGEHEERVYLVFEFLTGRSLRAEMGGRPMNVRRAVEIAIQIADAVAEAHAAGFLHGGLSPETVTITAKGHAKIPAFELAVRGGFETATAAGTGRGTFVRLADYDSPEEARGEPPDDRSDVYSIGAILYEMLTTRRPSHRGASAPSATSANVPKELDEVTLKAIAPNAASRYQGVALLAAELRGLVPVFDARGVGDDEGLPEPRSAGGSRVALVAGVALVVLGAILWWIMRS
jgi:serine/threonine-protein kinase